MSTMDSPSTSWNWLTKLRERLGSWKRLVAGAFTVILFGYLVYTLVINRRALSEFDWHITPSYLLASLAAYSLSLLLGASAWHRIVWSMDQRVSYRKGTKFFLQSSLAKRLPGFVWYALGRLYLYEREGVSKATISIGLALELVSITGGAVLAYVSTVWASVPVSSPLEGWWLVLPLVGLAVATAWPRGLYAIINWFLDHLGRRPVNTRASRGELAWWLLLQAAAWLSGGLFVYFLSMGVYPDLDWSYAVKVVNSWVASGLIALGTLILPLGLGLKEISLAYLLSSFLPWPIAVVISLLGRVCSTIVDCLGLLAAHWL